MSLTTIPLVQFNNGKTCPVLGLGTWKSQPGEVAQAVKDAIDIGYRHFDCAFVYGNEKEVGEALREKLDEGIVTREDLFITSKIWCTHHHPDYVEHAISVTLLNLGLDYLDLYLIHWPQAYKEGDELFPKDESGKLIYSDVDYMDTWRELEKLVEKGQVKSLGVSNFNKEQLDRVVSEGTIKPVLLQIEVHPYLNQVSMLEHCKTENVTVTAYSPLGSPDRPSASADEPQLLDDPKVVEIAEKYHKTPAQILIRYAIDRGLIVIPKSVTKKRIAENYHVFDFFLADVDIEAIGTLERNGRLCSLEDKDHKYYPFKEE